MKPKLSPLVFALACFLLGCPPFLLGQGALPLTTLYNFGARRNGEGYKDALPIAGLVRGSDGNLYGTTLRRGDNDGGTIFKITPGGALTVLHNFPADDTDGAWPYGRLIQGSDGNFYGTTTGGGSDNYGTVFRITPAGVLTILHRFARNDSAGFEPEAGLVQGRDGNFYGTALGGINGSGVIFQMTPAGVLTVLHSFPEKDTDGAGPSGELVQASDGNFYGTTYAGGGINGGGGTVYRMTPAGVLTILHRFDGNDTDGGGSSPEAGLV